eukprot:4584167-Amphidinium_carterae.1
MCKKVDPSSKVVVVELRHFEYACHTSTAASKGHDLNVEVLAADVHVLLAHLRKAGQPDSFSIY